MRRGGYTLIELVSAMALVVALLMAAVAAYPSWGRIHAMRAAESLMMGELQRARQFAVTHGRPVRLCITNSVPDSPRPPLGRIWVSCATPDIADTTGQFPLCIGKTNDLPRGVFFVLTKSGADDPVDDASRFERPTSVTFAPDGGCAVGGDWGEPEGEGSNDWGADEVRRIFLLRHRQRTGPKDAPRYLQLGFEVHRLTGLARVLTEQEVAAELPSP
ncbi:MAG: hypothetical protein ACOX5G_07685 [Kiritimatiellia bacterium]|jgi:type II secretory pathway pseudopilin PulG